MSDETGTTEMKGEAPARAGLTPKQAQVLKFLRTYTSETDGVPPTYREIGAACGLNASGVHRVVVALHERGHITRLPGRERSLAVVE